MKICTFVYILFFFAVFHFGEAAFGIDISAEATVAQLQQFHTNNSFFIARIYRSAGTVDPAGIANILKARQAGFVDVHAYIFPCANSCQKSAAAQVTEAIDGLEAQEAQVAAIWLDIEVPFLWTTNFTANINFISEMLLTVGDRGYTCGIYTGKLDWKGITGNSEEFSKLMLWWTSYTGVADLTTEWESFGGWTSPTIHQYSDDRTSYGLGYHSNFKN